MKISDWLDEKEKEIGDVSQIDLPRDLAFDEAPEETIFFKEINPCGMLCAENHPFSTVERFGHWYCARGQDARAGIHATGMKWHLFAKDKALAMQAANSHLKNP